MYTIPKMDGYLVFEIAILHYHVISGIIIVFLVQRQGVIAATII